MKKDKKQKIAPPYAQNLFFASFPKASFRSKPQAIPNAKN